MGPSVDKRQELSSAPEGRRVPRFRPFASGFVADAPIEPPAPPTHSAAVGAGARSGVSRVVAEAAHDFNNILSVILSCADELLAAPLDSEQRQRVLEIRTAGLRGSALNRKLIDASRAGTVVPDPTPTGVGDAIETAAGLLRRTLGPRIRLELELDGDLPLALCAGEELVTSLLNLGANARDAMPGGGTLILRAALTAIGGDDHVLGAGWYVRIDVADDGVGMTPRVLRRARDPYFTTKAERGTGLGLAAVAGVARSAGGDLRIASAPGTGTTVTILLPAVRPNGDPLAIGAW